MQMENWPLCQVRRVEYSFWSGFSSTKCSDTYRVHVHPHSQYVQKPSFWQMINISFPPCLMPRPPSEKMQKGSGNMYCTVVSVHCIVHANQVAEFQYVMLIKNVWIHPCKQCLYRGVNSWCYQRKNGVVWKVVAKAERESISLHLCIRMLTSQLNEEVLSRFNLYCTMIQWGKDQHAASCATPLHEQETSSIMCIALVKVIYIYTRLCCTST